MFRGTERNREGNEGWEQMAYYVVQTSIFSPPMLIVADYSLFRIFLSLIFDSAFSDSGLLWITVVQYDYRPQLKFYFSHTIDNTPPDSVQSVYKEIMKPISFNWQDQDIYVNAFMK